MQSTVQVQKRLIISLYIIFMLSCSLPQMCLHLWWVKWLLGGRNLDSFIRASFPALGASQALTQNWFSVGCNRVFQEHTWTKSYWCSSVTWAGYSSLCVEAPKSCFYLSKSYLESGFIYIYIYIHVYVYVYDVYIHGCISIVAMN